VKPRSYRSMRVHEVDVAIVGAGIAGASTAFHLAGLGRSIAVLEAAGQAAGASGANAGTIWSTGRADQSDLASLLTNGSLEILQSLEREHHVDLGLTQCGALKCIQTQKEAEFAYDSVRRMRAADHDVEYLDAGKTASLEPMINPGLAGSVHYPSAAAADPRKTTGAFLTLAQRLGVSIYWGAHIQSVESLKEGYRIRTPIGEWRAQKFVLACGAWTPTVSRMLQVPLPVFAVRGQMWAARAEPRKVTRILGAMESTLYWSHNRTVPVPELTHEAGTIRTRHLYGRQLESGELIFGGARDVNPSIEPSLTDRDLSFGHVAEILPFVAGLDIVRTWVSWMPFTPDLRPLIGAIPGRPGLYVLTALYSGGFERSPLAGKLLAQFIHTGVLPEMLSGAACELGKPGEIGIVPEYPPVPLGPPLKTTPVRVTRDCEAPALFRLIGSTPIARLQRLYPSFNGEIFAKLEGLNPGGSSKDRAAARMLLEATQRGLLAPGMTVVESSSGNMAVGLAQMCLQLGLKLICVLDSQVPAATLRILRCYGAEVDVVTADPRNRYAPQEMRIRRVLEILAGSPSAFWPNQYANEFNAAAHHQTMQEIVDQLDGRVDYLLVPVSTCGTIRGCAEYVRSNGIQAEIVAVDSIDSVIFGGPGKPRKVIGHGAARRPELFGEEYVNSVVLVTDEEAILGCHRLLYTEGLLAGGSSGAVVAALGRICPQLAEGARCAVIFPDRGERYSETVFCKEWLDLHFPGLTVQLEQSKRTSGIWNE